MSRFDLIILHSVHVLRHFMHFLIECALVVVNLDFVNLFWLTENTEINVNMPILHHSLRGHVVIMVNLHVVHVINNRHSLKYVSWFECGHGCTHMTQLIITL